MDDVCFTEIYRTGAGTDRVEEKPVYLCAGDATEVPRYLSATDVDLGVNFVEESE